MALPEIIEELFGALYEAQTGIFGDKEKAQARYEAILAQATRQYGCTKGELLKVVLGRYRRWVRESGLHLPPEE